MTQITSHNGTRIEGYESDRIEDAVAFYLPLFDTPGREVVVVDLCPGNGSRYVMVFTPLSDAQATVVGNRWMLSFGPDNGRQCYPFGLYAGNYTDAYYLMEKWNLRLPDAAPIADFINGIQKRLTADS